MFDVEDRQLELFERPRLTLEELEKEASAIWGIYWFIRNSCRVNRIGKAKLRRHYREAAKIKKRLLLAGVAKQDILDYLRCCRRQCGGCKYCPYPPR
jgi:hypothetical protein